MTMRLRRLGIGGRLGMAFGLSALLAIAACIIGWFSYARVSSVVRDVVRIELPAAASAAEVARLAGSIAALAPLLSQSRTSEQLDHIASQLAARLRDVRHIVIPAPETTAAAFPVVAAALESNITRIRAEALVAIALTSRNENLLREVRGLHSDFVEEAEPLIDDARFMARSLLEHYRSRNESQPETVDELRRTITNTETILQASSHANLAVGLLSRIAAVSTPEQLIIDDHFLAETVDLIRQQLDALSAAPEFGSLRQHLIRLIEIARTDSGLPHVRRLEIAQSQLLETLLKENRALLVQFEAIVAEAVDGASQRSVASARAIETTIDLGRNLLLLVAVLAVLAALVMALSYVHGDLLRRIRTLADAARLLATGRMPAPIEVTGGDELADMARAMEQFRRTQNELVQSAKFAALGHLSVGLAHELNQPLNAIRAQAHNALVLQERGDIEATRRAMEKVQTLTQRASLVVSHLKKFSRRGAESLTPVSLSTVIEGVVLIVEARLHENDITLTCHNIEDIRVIADEIRLEQVFVNLLSNAIDATIGRPRREIHIRAELSHNVARLSVADTGLGLDPDIAATLFDPFTTTKPPGQGLGLGLAISDSIIRDFGGALRATSGTDGTVFTIELRAADKE